MAVRDRLLKDVYITKGVGTMTKRAKKGWHDNKLCSLACCECRTDVAELRPLVKNAKFICKECGRAAAKAENLCAPEPL